MRGTGIVWDRGRPCRYLVDNPSGEGFPVFEERPFNPDADPFTADGEGFADAAGRSGQAWADRYNGGDRSKAFNAAALQPEWMMYVGPALDAVAAGKYPLPLGARIDPGFQGDGRATFRERADAEYMATIDWLAPFKAGLLPSQAGDGKTPETAADVSLPPLSSTLEWIAELAGGAMVYLHNTAPGAAGLSPRWPAGRFPPGKGPGQPPVEPPKPGAAEVTLAKIKAAAKDAADKLAAIKPAAKGKPASILGDLLKKIFELMPVLFLLAVLPALSGCAAFRVMNPFDSVTAADIEFSGVKTGEVAPLSVTLGGVLDERLGTVAQLLSLLGQGDPLGVLLRLDVVGETAPRFVLCTEKWVAKCRGIPINDTVHFAGKPAGLFWRPSRLTANHFND